MSTLASDLNDIEFSIGDENCTTAKLPLRIHSASEMDGTRQQMLVHRSITAEVVAKIQAAENVDLTSTGQDMANERLHRERNKVLSAGLNGANHGVDMKEGELLDETGEFVIHNVAIVKSSSSPLGFFIRQGDGHFNKQGIFVSRVAKGSFVDVNDLLKVGDQIVAVNHVEVEGFTLDDVVRLIQIPQKLILSIKTSAFSIKRSPAVGDASISIAAHNKRAEKGSSKAFKSKNKKSRANDYQEPSNREKHTQQIGAENFKVDNSNANEVQDHSRSFVLSQGSSTIEDLINAIRAQNSRAKSAEQSVQRVESSPVNQTQASRTQDAVNPTSSSLKPRETSKPGTPTRNPSADSIILSKRTPPSMPRKSSTLTPVTTVNLIFDDPEDSTVSAPSSETNVNKTSVPQDDSLKVLSPGLLPRSPTGSPGESPKMRRRLPSVPSDSGRSSRSGTERSVSESCSECGSPTTTSAKPLLALPPEPRSRRMLPTPPPSPVAPHKELFDSRKTSSENHEGGKSNRSSWSGPSDSESVDEKSLSPSPSRRDSGMFLSHLFSALAFKNHSDATDAGDKSKDIQERTESYKILSSPQRPVRKSEPTQQDILEQQKHSMLLHSYASGGLQPPRRLVTRSSQPNLSLTAPAEEPSKTLGKLSADSQASNDHENSEVSPKLAKRRASLASITDKSLTNQLASQDMTDTSRVRSEAEEGFLIFPDDYSGQNLLSSHAVSGMVSLHIIKATNLQFTDKKLLEKKKKVYCAVEVDFERKALTSSKRASKSLTWDEMFEVEIQHGREVSLSCFTSSREFDKPVAKVSFNLSPFVRCGKEHKVVFRMQPQGAIHLEMEFIEMRTLLKRAPSDRKSGVFGFKLNVTSRNENASVPLIVRKCVEEIERRGMTSQGLYRISGNARRKKQLHAQFDEDSTTVDLSEENYPDVNVIAGILKDYLRELPEPLITESLSKILIKAAKDKVQEQDAASQKRVLSKLLVQLPPINRETLVYLLNHFMRVIAEKDTNKMDAHNLSVCFGPVLLCPPANLTESKDLLDLKLHIKTVEFLFYLWKNAGMAST